MLRPSNREGLFETRLGLRQVSLRCPENDFTCNAMNFSLPPSFIRSFRLPSGFFDRAPCGVEFTKLRLAVARCARYRGVKYVAPVDRNALIPEPISSTAFDAFPLTTNKQPC